MFNSVKNVIVRILFPRREASNPPVFETSMNFSSRDVRPFLLLLNNRMQLFLDVEGISAFVASTPLDHSRTVRAPVTFEANKLPIDIEIFMDDIDSPDLTFKMRSGALCAAIDAALLDFAEANGN